MNSKYFHNVKVNQPRLNKFDWSYSDLLSAQIGFLYPVQCDFLYPGSVVKTGCYVHSEVMPLVSPLMCDLQMYIHQFFVPCRLMYGFDPDDGKNIFEKWITGGQDGTYDVPLPSWSPSFEDNNFSSKKIWDYIGLPMKFETSSQEGEQPITWSPLVPNGVPVFDFPKRAYNLVYNDFYRDEFRIDELDIATNEDLQRVSFRKDYFTSASDEPLLGPVPALPVSFSGTSPVNWTTLSGGLEGISSGYTHPTLMPFKDDNTRLLVVARSDGSMTDGQSYDSQLGGIRGSVDSAGFVANSFDINFLRFSFALQRLLEMNAISGVRYTEFLTAHWNASPRDERLDRPEYVGGCVINFNFGVSLQTSESGETKQGHKVGYGSLDSVQRLGRYRALEYGVLLTCMSIRPKPIYKQGVNRQWLCEGGRRESLFSPEFAFLGQQGILNSEIYVDPDDVDEDNVPEDSKIFGYQSAWNFLRAKNNYVSGSVREQFSHWTMARKFDSRPALNKDFLEIVNTDFNEPFAVQNEDEFIVSFSNLIEAYLPLPLYSNPGLIDHVYGQ